MGAITTPKIAETNSAPKPFNVYEFSTEGFDDCVAVVIEPAMGSAKAIALQCR